MQFSEFAIALDAELKEASQTFPVAAQFGPISDDTFFIALASPHEQEQKLHYVQVSLPLDCDVASFKSRLQAALASLKEQVAPDNRPKAQVVSLR